MLHRETISDSLFEALENLCSATELSQFRLVGGTALALQLGHRKSDDLDFFTNRSFDKTAVRQAILSLPGLVTLLVDKPTGFSFSYDPKTGHQPFKIDVYNWGVPFIKMPVIEGVVRMASLEDIAALKLDAICSRKEQKDYVDMAELLEKFSFENMLSFYKEKFQFADTRTVLSEIANTNGIENSIKPVMLHKLSSTEAVYKVYSAVKAYSEQIVANKMKVEKQRQETIQNLLLKKSKSNKTKGPSL